MHKPNGGAALAHTAADSRYGSVLAEVVGFADASRPVVAFEGQRVTCVGSAVELDRACVGSSVIVMFLDGDPNRPIVTGKLQSVGSAAPTGVARPDHLDVDAGELRLSADKQLTLRCGKSSIVLTADGRIVIRGEHLLSRATSVNRIRGGTILLN